MLLLLLLLEVVWRLILVCMVTCLLSMMRWRGISEVGVMRWVLQRRAEIRPLLALAWLARRWQAAGGGRSRRGGSRRRRGSGRVRRTVTIAGERAGA